MTAEQQLERSVLESKEREELHAIAQAMDIKTTARSKKSDLIDQILSATGVPNGSATNGDHASPNGSAEPATEVAANARTRPASASRSNGSKTPSMEDIEAELDLTITTNGSATSDDSESDDSDDIDDSDHSDDRDERPRAPVATRTSQQSQQRTGNRPGAGNSNANPNSNANSHGSQQGVEAGNRRNNRRRRGRERGPETQREFQGGSGQEGPYNGELVEVRGLIDLREEGYGFLRCDGYLPSSKDVYVSISQARRFALRKGDYIEGACRPASNNERYPALLRIDTVSGLEPEEARNRPRFEDLTPLFPDERLNLEESGEKDNLTARIVDLLCPIGKGQRGLVVSPPKAGKTTVMKHIAHSIEANNPEVHLMVLLVDERPEEVTDMRRSVKGEVIASTFDRPADEHTTVAELAIDRAKRMVEMGKDVVIILDGITRLARAYNLAAPATGRIMSGGVDSGALYPPKKFFGAARNIEEGGSLTILATALVETGSKMDEVIFEEFKGTGNMELRLDRRLAERRLYPSIDVNASSTRHEELLFDRGELQQVWKLRRVLNALAAEGNAAPGLELLMDKIRTTKSNTEFLAEIAKGPTPNG
jgi:transcription termination factor Rho